MLTVSLSQRGYGWQYLYFNYLFTACMRCWLNGSKVLEAFCRMHRKMVILRIILRSKCVRKKLNGSNYIYILFLRAIKRVVLLTPHLNLFQLKWSKLLVLQLIPPQTSFCHSSTQTFLCRQLCLVNRNPAETLDPSCLAAFQLSLWIFTPKLFIWICNCMWDSW